jgi:thioredoxin 1
MTSGDGPTAQEPTREEIERTTGPIVLEFGTSWCCHCQTLAPRLAALLKQYPGVRHIKVEDGPGKPLGRSFRVRLWPTLVFLRDGVMIDRAVRPEADEVRKGLDALTRDALSG